MPVIFAAHGAPILLDDSGTSCSSRPRTLPDREAAASRLPSPPASFVVREREPDLIVAALRLPGCDGLTLMKLVRTLKWSTPVLLTAARDDSETFARVTRALTVPVC